MTQYKTNRTGWVPGPWDGEPDREEWRSRGFPCLIVRNHMGALCGYVGVTKGHPWYEVGNYAVYADVHGGVTYNARCRDGICHVPKPGESDDVWWIGFDCAHWRDIVPQTAALRRRLDPRPLKDPLDQYRDMAYVRAEVERLADQAEAAR